MSLTRHLTAGDILNALRGASCPYSALHFYSLLRLRLRPSEPSYFAWRAAVFTLKQLSAASSLPLLSHFHGHLLRSNLLAYPHVASSLLRSYSLLSPPAAHQLFDQIPSTTCNLYVLNVMLASLCRSSDLDSARTFFDGIPDKDVVSWSTMLACYFSNGHLADGLAFFHTMIFSTDIAVDCAMLATLLTSCASAGFLPLFCRAIHGYAVRHSVPASMHLGTALIDCYAKANRIDYATRVFARMTKRNVVHWTIMICGMGSQLRNIEAVHLFEEMCQTRVQPNEMTFTAVLNACVNAGLVEKGRELFKLMVDTYHLEPNIHHYGCMVDLYAKAGLLEDAYEAIKTMKVEPNIITWTSLLAACKKVKNFEIAIMGIEKVLAREISDENAGLYMLISDLYAMGGRWDDVLKIRRLVEERGVWKNRGLNSIKVDDLPGIATRTTLQQGNLYVRAGPQTNSMMRLQAQESVTIMFSLPKPPLYVVTNPQLLPGVCCYTDAATQPDHGLQVPRRAGLGIYIIDPHRQRTIFIRACHDDITSVLMAEAAAMSLAAAIISELQIQELTFLTDSQQLVTYFNGQDLSNPPHLNIKNYTQNFINRMPASAAKVYKISRGLNSTAHSLAKQALQNSNINNLEEQLLCTNSAHLEHECPLRTAINSVCRDNVLIIAASCC